MLCQNNTRMVDALKQQHGDRFATSFRPREDHLDELKQHGMQSHGIVCVDSSGDTLWLHADHQVTQAQFDAGLAQVLGKLDDAGGD